jgi:hypothetical protein
MSNVIGFPKRTDNDEMFGECPHCHRVDNIGPFAIGIKPSGISAEICSAIGARKQRRIGNAIGIGLRRTERFGRIQSGGRNDLLPPRPGGKLP